MFSRYLDFFDIEKATPMVTWAGGTRRIYECLSQDFKDRIRLNTAVTRIERDGSGVTVEDSTGAMIFRHENGRLVRGTTTPAFAASLQARGHGLAMSKLFA